MENIVIDMADTIDMKTFALLQIAQNRRELAEAMAADLPADVTEILELIGSLKRLALGAGASEAEIEAAGITA